MCTDKRFNLIGKIEFLDEDSEPRAGTGFLINKNTVITAFHNIKAYKELNNEFSITFNSVKECRILEIIDYNEELDIAIIEIDNLIDSKKYFKLVEFPNINNDGVTIQGIEVNIIGFRASEENPEIFLGKINNPDIEGNVIIAYDRGPELSDGLSGSPTVMKETFYVYGLNTEQNDPDSGLHLKSIITFSSRFREFLSRNEISIRKFESHKLIEKDIYKERLLGEVSDEIENKEMLDVKIRRRIIKESCNFIDILNDMNPIKFEEFINSIKLHSEKNKKFELDSNYKASINAITEIICHISIIEVVYSGKEITFEMLKSIKIKNKKYLSYIYPFEVNSYILNAHKLFKYMLKHPECNFDGINQVLLGNTSTNGKCRGCNKDSIGVEIDFSKIINNICTTDGYDMEEDEDRLEITKVKNNLELINFHCSNCFTYDDKEHIKEIKVNVENILGE